VKPPVVPVGSTTTSPSDRPRTISVPVPPTSPVSTWTVASVSPWRRVTVEVVPMVVIALVGT